jgi:hypothetical protein
MAINPLYLDEARHVITNTPFKAKTYVAEKWARLFGIAPQTLWKLIKNKERKREGKVLNQEYYTWAEIIFQIKKRPPEEAGEISTEDAVAIAVKSELVPDTALDVPTATYNTIARKKGWTKTVTRANRFQADRPNKAHHFDASTSKFLYIDDKIGSNDFLLKLHRPAKHYKNKPIPIEKLRPWIYGLTDDYSGLFIARYTAATGESSDDSSDFLAWVWAQIGLPEQLLADQGMLKKALHSRDLIERLEIGLPEMMPYQKRGHGKIERPWRTAWQKFEKPFFAAVTDWGKFKISMTELNVELKHFYEDKYNELPHRFEKTITRQQAWNKVNLYGGIVKIPENVLRTVARRTRRKVGVDGLVHLNNVPYEVVGLYDAWVDLFEGVFEERIVALEIKTGQKYSVKDFKPLNLGEFRSYADTPHQVIVKASENLKLVGNNLYADKKSEPEKIISIPIRTKENRAIEDPFNVDSFASLQEAMRELYSIVGIRIDPDQKEVIEKAIVEHGMDKAFVTDLALEIRASIERQRMAM